MTKTLGSFKLDIHAGSFTDSEIIVMLGENGTGKTTFIRMLAGSLKPDGGSKMPSLNISYKPQKISPKSEKTVQNLLYEKMRAAFTHPQFATDVLKPLQMERLYDQEASNFSTFIYFVIICCCVAMFIAFIISIISVSLHGLYLLIL